MSTWEPGFPLWYARTPRPGGGMHLDIVMSSEHPPRQVVDVAEGSSPGPVLCRADYRADGELIRNAPEPEYATGAVDQWYVEVPEPDADPPATNVVAFATPEWPDGTLVARADFDAAGIDLREQVGALRWWVGNGKVHQVYVAPHMRRRRVGTKLILTAGLIALGRRWALLWAGGDLTDEGAALVSAAVWSARVAPRSRVMPPMTPPGEAVEP